MDEKGIIQSTMFALGILLTCSRWKRSMMLSLPATVWSEIPSLRKVSLSSESSSSLYFSILFAQIGIHASMIVQGPRLQWDAECIFILKPTAVYKLYSKREKRRILHFLRVLVTFKIASHFCWYSMCYMFQQCQFSGM